MLIIISLTKIDYEFTITVHKIEGFIDKEIRNSLEGVIYIFTLYVVFFK